MASIPKRYQPVKVRDGVWKLENYYIYHLKEQKEYLLITRTANRAVGFYFTTKQEAVDAAVWNIEHWHIKQRGKMPIKKSKRSQKKGFAKTK